MPYPPKIAVLLAAYNGTQWIEAQLATIQAQVAVEVHIIISVDPSSDGTDRWCEEYAAAHANVSLLPPAERCGGAARNFFHLIRDTNLDGFDFIAFSDQDDLWNEDKLERAAKYLYSHSADAYSSNVTAFWPNGRAQLLDKAQAQVKWDHYFEAAGPGCTYVLKNSFANFLQLRVRSNWLETQEVKLHDWYIYALARSNGYHWYIDTASTLKYRQHDNNQFGANIGFRAILSRLGKIRSGWWFDQVRLIESLANNNKHESQRPPWKAITHADLMGLVLNGAACRRRPRDKILFMILCCISAIIGA
jgi:rhamnosyltransferase